MNEPNADEWKDTATRLRAELDLCRNIRSEAVARLMEAAAFLDALADIGVLSSVHAQNCRAMARKCRGEA